MMYAVGSAATRHCFCATSFATRIVGSLSRSVFAATAGVWNPFGPFRPALIAAVTTCSPLRRCDRNRLILGNSFRQCGQVFNQNTTAVGFPNKDANLSVPLPVK